MARRLTIHRNEQSVVRLRGEAFSQEQGWSAGRLQHASTQFLKGLLLFHHRSARKIHPDRAIQTGNDRTAANIRTLPA